MSYPRLVFIDTSIFDESRYNFSSASFISFREAVKDKGLVLLLPEPTAQEIERHIKDRVEYAIKALKAAQHEAPFLTKLPDWPLNKEGYPSLDFTVRNAIHKELNEFLSLFSVEKLGYEKIEVKEVMEWYDKRRAPFGEGRKRKEFPDAFAIDVLKNHSEENDEAIAVISKDPDFERACSIYPKLFYYKSLRSFTEAVRSGDKRVDMLRGLLEKDESKIIEAISNNFPLLTFCIEANWEGDAEDIQVEDADFKSLNVVGIGESEFSLGFEANVSYSAYVTYEDLETASYDSEDKVLIPWHTIEGTMQDTNKVTGIMKGKLSKDGTSIDNIHIVEFDDDFVLITSRPEESF